MTEFTFNRGTWEDGTPLPAWDDNEDSDAYLKRIGYISRAAEFGHEYGGQIDISESCKNDTFYATVCPAGGTVFSVYLPDFPSFMMFMRDYATPFSTEGANFAGQETLKILEKMFLLQHGHSPHQICAKCDPVGWENQRRFVEANRKG